MTVCIRSLRLLFLAAALSIGLAACGAGTAGVASPGIDEGEPAAGRCLPESPDCVDTPDDPEEPGTDPAAGSCLAGDDTCTDESYDGQDAAQPVTLSDRPSGAERIGRGATTGATGRAIDSAYLVDESTLELTFMGGVCDLVEDVLVDATRDEVRLMVLSGTDATVDVCTQQMVTWSIEIALDEPLGERTVIDLAA